ncbi:hypothetical protein ABZP36_005366 [Zizania latifolia]
MLAVFDRAVARSPEGLRHPRAAGDDSVFIATDADDSVPFYWGVEPDGRPVVSDEAEVLKKACEKSSSPFPKVPVFDSKGEACGTTYTVDAKARKDSGIPRVGSAADWSSQY